MLNLILIFLVVLLGGCATSRQPQLNFTVESLASPTAKNRKTYPLISGNSGVLKQDLQFQEYESYLIRALNSQGFISAKSEEDADLAIVLSYGIGDPQTQQYSYTLVEKAASSAKKYGTHVITGYSTVWASRTTFFRYAIITGYNFSGFKESGKPVQLWQTTISSRGSSRDLKRIFPMLVGAALPYLATNTEQKVPVSLSESDKVVKIVKGEISEQ